MWTTKYYTQCSCQYHLWLSPDCTERHSSSMSLQQVTQLSSYTKCTGCQIAEVNAIPQDPFALSVHHDRACRTDFLPRQEAQYRMLKSLSCKKCRTAICKQQCWKHVVTAECGWRGWMPKCLSSSLSATTAARRADRRSAGFSICLI